MGGYARGKMSYIWLTRYGGLGLSLSYLLAVVYYSLANIIHNVAAT